MSIAWTAIIALFVLFVIGVVSVFVRIPKEEETVAHGEAASILMSGVLSMVIASLAYFRVQGEIEFLSWGVMLGVLGAGMVIRTDKLTLALLYFLDPRGAVGLYRLLEARDSVEDQRSRGRVAAETSRLAVEKRKTAAFRLANELEEQLDEVVHVHGSALISATIEKLRNVTDPQSEESRRIVAEARQLIAHIRRVGDVPKRALPIGATVAERIRGHRGLSESDIREAIDSKLIDPTQAYLWTPETQLQLADSADDIEQDRTSGRSPILVADNLTSYFEQHPKTLEALTLALTASNIKKDFRIIRGAEADGWHEFGFAMPTRSLTAVLRTGPNGDYLILGVFPAAPQAPSHAAPRDGASPSP